MKKRISVILLTSVLTFGTVNEALAWKFFGTEQEMMQPVDMGNGCTGYFAQDKTYVFGICISTSLPYMVDQDCPQDVNEGLQDTSYDDLFY